MICRDMREGDLAELIPLWCECFGDDEATAHDFYRCVGVHGVVAEEDEKIVSMINIVRCEMKNEGRIIKGGFIYAACTDAKMRGRGIFRALNEYAEEYMKRNEMEFLMLIPANDGLFPMYRGLGYINEAYSADYADTGYTDGFDGDIYRLYSLYLEMLPETAFVKSRGLFEYVLGFDDCTPNYTADGYNVKASDGYVYESGRITNIGIKPKALYKWAHGGYDIKEKLTVDFFGEDRHKQK